MSDVPTYIQVILETGPDGRARWREASIALTEGKPQARLSPLMPSGGMQLRESPVGFRSEFHCTGDPQWVFILQGAMEIGLQDGSSRVFRAGQHFFSVFIPTAIIAAFVFIYPLFVNLVWAMGGAGRQIQ